MGVVSATGARPRRSVQVRDRLAAHLRAGDVDLRRRRPAADRGRVVLVGGGPGHVGLLTVAGRRAPAEADVVVADRLGPSEVLDDLPPDVAGVDVGRSPGHHPVPQKEVNRILVEQQAQRGGAVHVMNGTDGWSSAALTGLRDGSCTVVVLMGVGVLPALVRDVLRGGVDPDVPVAVVERATLPDQRVTHAALHEVAAVAAARGVRAPAVLVLGEVARARPAGGPAGRTGGHGRAGRAHNGRVKADMIDQTLAGCVVLVTADRRATELQEQS